MKSMNGNANLHQQPLSRQIVFVLGGAAAVLLVPLVAMQFTSEVNWDIVDFVAMGMLLVVAGLLYVAGSRAVKTRQQRVVVGVVVAGLLFLTWTELAVGIFGTPFAGS
jgi:dipeptide/tripeptide permease